MYALELSDSEALKIKQIVDTHNETLIAKRSKRVYKDCKTVVYEPLFTLTLTEDHCTVEYLPAQTVGNIPVVAVDKVSKPKIVPVLPSKSPKETQEVAPRKSRLCKIPIPAAKELAEITDTIEVSNPTLEPIVEGPIIQEPERRGRGRPRKV